MENRTIIHLNIPLPVFLSNEDENLKALHVEIEFQHKRLEPKIQ